MKAKVLLQFFIAIVLLFPVQGQEPTVVYSSMISSNNSRVELTIFPEFRQGRIQAENGGYQYWSFHIGTVFGPDYSVNWRPYTTGNSLNANDFIPTSFDNGARYNTTNGGHDGGIQNVVVGRYYTFNITDNASQNNTMCVLETSYEPRVITMVSQLPEASCVRPGQPVQIHFELNGVPSTGTTNLDREIFIVRYSNDNFATSQFLQATISGTHGTAEIPGFASGNISYYVYSTNLSFAEITNRTGMYNHNLAHDMSTLNLNNNGGGGNYPYTPVAATFSGTWDQPLDGRPIVFAADYDSDIDGGSVSGCSCAINANVEVTIRNGHSLNLEHGINIHASGVLNIESGASLFQEDDSAENIGMATIKRNTQPVYRYDFTYWSSPVTETSSFTLGDLSPDTLVDKYFSWDALNQDWFSESNATIMEEGKGYIVRAPQFYDIEGQPGAIAEIFEGFFIGTPNNGNVSTPVEVGWNLIGNPYPSSIFADDFVDANPDLNGTFYFWTHNSQPTAYNYNVDDYALYNRTGSTGNPAGTSGNTTAPNGYIASGQSFFIESILATDVVFNNAMRRVDNNDVFFRQGDHDKSRIWINLFGNNGLSQALVGYLPGATNGIDRLYDGKKLGGNAVSLYSINQQEELTIQGRQFPFEETDQVPLGFKVNNNGNFTLQLERFDGIFSNHNIYLEDRLLGTIHNLKISPYQFNSTAGTFNDRFLLRYNEALSNPEFTIDNEISIFNVDKGFLIESKEILKAVTAFDLLGRQIFAVSNLSDQKYLIEDTKISGQVLILKVQLQNGAIINKKVIWE
ncbi:T9SS sorting signal type C domain-containing protein [Flavobacterium sp. NST-5]|uniref:T9SS sorting signal type C domain-containing protein n=1 Tax=Flavobacterium ichthyis TaxID=2698827 RepID=A0ABW9Z730_9FLAO|nr:T9SS sorting signal type C domain-containing protein [Flavobacterium ichthyis]NBL64688.1 T9SS sorting signal type C domain-containing protein [Flavobacterium ichthyis]